MVIEPIWYKYATFDEDGFVNGVEENAPDDVKNAYANYVRETEQANNSNERIQR